MGVEFDIIFMILLRSALIMETKKVLAAVVNLKEKLKGPHKPIFCPTILSGLITGESMRTQAEAALASGDIGAHQPMERQWQQLDAALPNTKFKDYLSNILRDHRVTVAEDGVLNVPDELRAAYFHVLESIATMVKEVKSVVQPVMGDLMELRQVLGGTAADKLNTLIKAFQIGRKTAEAAC